MKTYIFILWVTVAWRLIQWCHSTLICRHEHSHTYAQTPTHTYVLLGAPTRSYAHQRATTRKYTQAHLHTPTPTHMRTPTHTHTRAPTRTRTYTHKRVHLHTQAPTRTSSHTRAHLLNAQTHYFDPNSLLQPLGCHDDTQMRLQQLCLRWEPWASFGEPRVSIWHTYWYQVDN